MRNKRPYELAVKKSVSMPEILFDKGCDRMRDLALSQFSDYIQLLIRKDTAEKNRLEGVLSERD
jgi:hypothetical protein